MKKLLIINVFLLILLSNVYALNDNKINGHIKTSSFNNNITASLVADNENKINKDYQLARATDLLLGINFYNQNNKK